MARRALPLIALLALLPAACRDRAGPDQAGPHLVIRSIDAADYPLVTAELAWIEAGRPIVGLSAATVEVYDDGIRLSQHQAAGEPPPGAYHLRPGDEITRLRIHGSEARGAGSVHSLAVAARHHASRSVGVLDYREGGRELALVREPTPGLPLTPLSVALFLAALAAGLTLAILGLARARRGRRPRTDVCPHCRRPREPGIPECLYCEDEPAPDGAASGSGQRPLDLDHTMLLPAGGPAGGIDGDSTPILKPVWTLRIEGPDGTPPRSVTLPAGPILLGAEPGAGISLAGLGLHAVELRLQPGADGVRFTALGQPGRLIAGGRPAVEAVVRSGGQVRLADLAITVGLELRRM